MKELLLNHGAEVIVTATFAMVAWIGTLLGQLLKSKAKNQLAETMLCRISDAALTAVTEVEHTIKQGLLAARSPTSDGGTKLTPEEIKQIKGAAISSVKSFLGKEWQRQIKKSLGLDAKAAESLISAKVESAVDTLRLGKS